MKHNVKCVLLGLIGIVILSAQAGAEETPVLSTEKDRISYAIGVEVARNFRKQQVDIDLNLMFQGLKDAYSGGRLLEPEKDLRKVTQAFQAEVRRKMVLNQRAAALENKKKGEAFLAENKAKLNIITLSSGLQYKILKAGTGAKPSEADLVECAYRGTLLDGTEFDASEAGKTVNLKTSALIPGWKEALKLMPAGSKWQLFIPSQLGYGERGVGSDIGPNETLIFEVELLGIK